MRQIVADATGPPGAGLRAPWRPPAWAPACWPPCGAGWYREPGRGRAGHAGRGRRQPIEPDPGAPARYRELLAHLRRASTRPCARPSPGSPPSAGGDRMTDDSTSCRSSRRSSPAAIPHPSWAGPCARPSDGSLVADSLAGAEAELVAGAGPRAPAGRGRRTRTPGRSWAGGCAAALPGAEPIVLDHPKADEATADLLQERTRHADALIAVGSGTINDLCKYVTHRTGRALRGVRDRALDGRLRHHHGLDHPRRLQAQPAGPRARAACSSTSPCWRPPPCG